MALALPTTYLNTLYYMQGFDGHGPLVRIIIGCVQGVKAPAIIFAVTIMGFACAFFLLFEGQAVDGESLQMSPYLAGLYTYTVMLAGFGLGDLDGSLNTFMHAFLLFAYTLFTYIIMINVLISVLSDDFDRIQENGRAEFTFARAEAVLEYQGMLSEAERLDSALFPTWLQVLVPTLESEEVTEGEWVGRVRELKNSVKQVKEKLEESEKTRKEEVKWLKKRLEESERERKEEVKELKSHNQSVEKLLAQIYAKLEDKDKDKDEDKKEGV